MILRATLVAALLVAACSSGSTTFTPPADVVSSDVVSSDVVSSDVVVSDVVSSDASVGDATGVDAQPDRPITDAVVADVRDATSVDAAVTDVASDRVQPDVATRDVPTTGARCGGRGTPPCAEGLFCNFPESSICGRADGPGTCDAIPEVCDRMFDPVCGCDGESYNNSCEAFSRGVSVDHAGSCTDVDAGASDCRTTGCPSGQSCMGCRGPSGGVFVCIPAGAVC